MYIQHYITSISVCGFRVDSQLHALSLFIRTPLVLLCFQMSVCLLIMSTMKLIALIVISKMYMTQIRLYFMLYRIAGTFRGVKNSFNSRKGGFRE